MEPRSPSSALGKTTRFCVLLCAALVLAISPANARPGSTSASASGHSRAEIVTPLRVETLSDLEFGTVAVAAEAGGTVTIDPKSGLAHYHGAAVSHCAANTPCVTRAARFRILGEAGRRYIVELPGHILAHSDNPASPSLSVERLTFASRNAPSAETGGVLDQRGEDFLSIGGTLVIPAGTPSATYRAQIQLVVVYD